MIGMLNVAEGSGQAFVNRVLLLTNWRLPLDEMLAVVKLCLYKAIRERQRDRRRAIVYVIAGIGRAGNNRSCTHRECVVRCAASWYL